MNRNTNSRKPLILSSLHSTSSVSDVSDTTTESQRKKLKRTRKKLISGGTIKQREHFANTTKTLLQVHQVKQLPSTIRFTRGSRLRDKKREGIASVQNKKKR